MMMRISCRAPRTTPGFYDITCSFIYKIRNYMLANHHLKSRLFPCLMVFIANQLIQAFAASALKGKYANALFTLNVLTYLFVMYHFMRMMIPKGELHAYDERRTRNAHLTNDELYALQNPVRNKKSL